MDRIAILVPKVLYYQWFNMAQQRRSL